MKTEDIDMQDDPDKPKNTTFKKALMKRYCKYITCHKNFSLDVRRMCVCVCSMERMHLDIVNPCPLRLFTNIAYFHKHNYE